MTDWPSSGFRTIRPAPGAPPQVRTPAEFGGMPAGQGSIPADRRKDRHGGDRNQIADTLARIVELGRTPGRQFVGKLWF